MSIMNLQIHLLLVIYQMIFYLKRLIHHDLKSRFNIDNNHQIHIALKLKRSKAMRFRNSCLDLYQIKYLSIFP